MCGSSKCYLTYMQMINIMLNGKLSAKSYLIVSPLPWCKISDRKLQRINSQEQLDFHETSSGSDQSELYRTESIGELEMDSPKGISPEQSYRRLVENNKKQFLKSKMRKQWESFSNHCIHFEINCKALSHFFVF